MKKTLLLFLLVAFCNLSHAQGTAAILINNYSVCTLHVTLYATDLGSGNAFPCDIMTSDIVILPSGTYGRSNPHDVRALGPGYGSFATFISSLPSVVDWIWDSAEFQYDCPGYGCNSGGNVNNVATGVTPCSLTPSTTWSGACSHSAGWMTSSGTIMDDHVIDFY